MASRSAFPRWQTWAKAAKAKLDQLMDKASGLRTLLTPAGVL
jgi:hypothetical protein